MLQSKIFSFRVLDNLYLKVNKGNPIILAIMENNEIIITQKTKCANKSLFQIKIFQLPALFYLIT